MRGTPIGQQLLTKLDGITPAYAGNTLGFVPFNTPPWDHPRVCGEHSVAATKQTSFPGSPPRMRGTPHHRTTHGNTGGITPAYAGNTALRL